MSKQSIELRYGNTLWATLREEDDGTKHLDLEQNLTNIQIDSYLGGLALRDSKGIPLTIGRRVNKIYICDRDGNKLLKLGVDNNDEIVDVSHPVVRLVLLSVGGGSIGNDPIRFSNLLLGLRWK